MLVQVSENRIVNTDHITDVEVRPHDRPEFRIPLRVNIHLAVSEGRWDETGRPNARKISLIAEEAVIFLDWIGRAVVDLALEEEG